METDVRRVLRKHGWKFRDYRPSGAGVFGGVSTFHHDAHPNHEIAVEDKFGGWWHLDHNTGRRPAAHVSNERYVPQGSKITPDKWVSGRPDASLDEYLAEAFMAS
jgi:hypothetical protein